MKRINNTLTGNLMLLAVVIFTAVSCTKSNLKPVDFQSQQSATTNAKSGSTGGGGNGGGGGNNGGGGTGVVTPPATPTTLPITDVVTSGTWKVTSYVEQTENSTNKFSGYTFIFNADKTLTAKNGGSVISGTWRPAEAIFYYGVPAYGSNPDGFFITLGSDLPLTLLAKNFFVSFKGLTTFTLSSINPSEDTHVTFSK